MEFEKRHNTIVGYFCKYFHLFCTGEQNRHRFLKELHQWLNIIFVIYGVLVIYTMFYLLVNAFVKI